MSLYTVVDLGIVALPLLLSFDAKVAFYRRWPSALPAILLVALPYLAWDVAATRLGHWAFNPQYSGSIRILGLPPGEVLFFLAIPYACLFTYEVVRAYSREKSYPLRPQYVAIAAVLFLLIGLGFLFLDSRRTGQVRPYSLAAVISVAAFLLVAIRLRPDLFASAYARRWMLLVYLAFIVSNGVLTGLPIVTYSPAAILGWRFFTIPVEDFFYNFAFLGFTLLVYRALEDRRARRQARPGTA